MTVQAVADGAVRPTVRNEGDAASQIRATQSMEGRSAGRFGAIPSLLLLGISVAIGAALAGRRPRPPQVRDANGSENVGGNAYAGAAYLLDTAAATLAATVLFDSGLEHYRAGFFKRAMYAAPVMSACTFLQAVRARGGAERYGDLREAIFSAAALTGLAGFGFHLTNLSRRQGGWSWLNLFYGAPVAAPLALTMAGALGLASGRMREIAGENDRTEPTLLGRPAGVVLGALGAVGLLGTAGEAWLFHFRGAFQHPSMYVPIIVPPAAAVALALAIRGDARRRAIARALLRGTALVGVAGVGFHAFGVHRSMGGWRNWTQNVLDGPPLPAPPAFTGLAFVGLAALRLVERGPRERAA